MNRKRPNVNQTVVGLLQFRLRSTIQIRRTMGEETKETTHKVNKTININKNRYQTRGGGAVYCLGLIGAAIYYIQNASGFWPVILAILKAIVWPAFFVYDILKFLHG